MALCLAADCPEAGKDKIGVGYRANGSRGAADHPLSLATVLFASAPKRK
jgi:hypothetical protein